MSRRISFWQSGAVVLGLLAFASRQGLPQQQDQGPDALANCWQDLAAEDAGLAFRATWRLVQNPQSAVKLLGQHLTPASPPDSPKIQAWLEDLQSTKYAVREKATKELELQAELAEPLLRKALETKPDLEMRRRVELLLSKLTQTVISTEKLIRAVEILEILGNAEATQLLQRLAKGFPGHRQTREAQESLQRLKQRAPVPEHWLTWTKAPPAAADKADALPFGARTRLGTTLFRQHGNGRQSLFSPDSSLLISNDDQAVYLWETQTGKLQRKFEIAADCLAVAPKGTLLALGLSRQEPDAGAVVWWDWQTGKELGRVKLPPKVNPQQLGFSPDGTEVLCRSSDENLRVWDAKTRQEIKSWQPSGNRQKLYGFSVDGGHILMGSRDEIAILDLKKGSKQILSGLEREPRHVAFSADGKHLAVSGDGGDERLQLWNVATGKLLMRSPEETSSRVRSLCFSDDGKTLAAGA